MSMNKAYNRINWENYPSLETPVNEQNLNKMDSSLDEIDNRIILQDTTKFDKSEAQYLVKNVILDEDNGILTIQYYNGAEKKYSSLLGKIAINFDFDRETQKIILYKPSGEAEEIDLSAFITEYEFADSGTIAFSVGEDGEVSAIVKDGSIQEKHLQPNYLADIKVEVAKAQSSATAASTSEANAKASENAAKDSENSAAESAENSATFATNAANSENIASSKATEAASSATSAATSADTATNKASEAATSATNAANSASTATSKADSANESAVNAANSATSAETYAKQAQSYAVGTGNVRQNEAIDNSKYYYEQAKSISEGLAGALRPMGTVTFANLPAIANATEGDMYNISDEFTTTADFKEGAGNVIPAGANAYKTADGYWDILAGTPVTSVNGQTGNVNITANSIEAVSSVFGIEASTLQEFVEKIMNGSNIGSSAGNINIKTDIGIGLTGYVQFIATWQSPYSGPYNINLNVILTETLGENNPTYRIKVNGKRGTYNIISIDKIEFNQDGTVFAGRATADGNGKNIDDTYLKRSGGTITGNLIPSGGIEYAGKGGYIAYPKDGALKDKAATATGCLYITLPNLWTNTMMRFTVSIYNFVEGGLADYIISGYNWASQGTWLYCAAVCVGKPEKDYSNLPVRFGHDGEKCIVAIGDISTAWHYAQIQIHDIILGNSNTELAKWSSGWNVSISNSYPTVVQTTIGNTHVAHGGAALSAIQDGYGKNIDGTYFKKSGGTIFGTIDISGDVFFNDSEKVYWSDKVSETEKNMMQGNSLQNMLAALIRKTGLTQNDI